MTKFIQCLVLLFLCISLQAFNGEQRLSKKNVIAILQTNNHRLLLNDANGNIFEYNGRDLSKLDFENDINSPTQFLIRNQEFSVFASANSIYHVSKAKVKTEILSLAPEENVISFDFNKSNFYVSTDRALYIINRTDNSNEKFFEGNIDQVRNIICGSEECYISLNNLVISPGDQNYVVAEMSEEILDLNLTEENELLILTINGLYVFNDGSSKQLVPAIGQLPDEIRFIKNSKRWLFLILDQSVFAFDWLNSDLTKLGSFNGRYQVSEIDQWSNLWLSSSNGIWNFSSSNDFESPHISDIKISDSKNKELDLNSFNFSSKSKLINVNPSLSYLPNHEQLITEWKTEKGDWSPFKNDFILSAEELQKGVNKIYIRAKASNSKYTLPYTFEINNNSLNTEIPSFWYLVFAVLIGLLLVAFLSLFNLRSKQNEASLQIKQLKAQNELLQSKQQIDQLKMNPHFIFNALTSINGLLASGKVKESRKSISVFSKFLRQFLNQSQDESISIEDEVQLLNNYVKIELLCRNDSFDFEIDDFSEELFDEKIPNMIIQPFVENSIIHAFGNLDRRGKINLNFQIKDGYLVANISDNGVGLGNAIKKSHDHKSIAIDLVKKRLAQRDKNGRKMYVEYSDNNPGTAVNIYLKKH